MRIQITDTTLRDAHQSLIATRMRTRDMLPIAEKLDAVGFFSLEVWGGATFDSCIRYLNEDPWDRLKELRAKVKNTRLQMLLRGQNLVGYRHYSDDVVREFIRLAVKNGVDVFRIFDALNDIRNMELAIQVAKSHGAHVQGTICYTTSPVHSVEGFAEMAVKLQKLGSDSICIKDMAGLIAPAAASDLVKAIKKRVTIPVDLHSHCSSGMAPLSYHAAALSGVDILDTAFSAFGWGSSQPTTESVVAALQGTPYDTGLDLGKLYEIGEYFAALFAKYKSLFTGEATRPNLAVLLHQIPGRDDLQPGQPVEGAERPGQTGGSPAGGAQGEGRPRLSAAGDTDQPDSGDPGGAQCPGGPTVHEGNPGSEELPAGLLRQGAGQGR